MKKKNINILNMLFVFLCMINSLAITAFAQELEAMIYVSNQRENFDTDKILREYIIGETAYCAVMVKGFLLDPAGNADISADLMLLGPDNEVLFEEADYAAFNREIDKSKNGIVLDNSFELEFTQDDPAGMYTIEVLVKDHLSELSDKTIMTLLLFDSLESKQVIMAPIQSPEQLDKLWAEYFRSKNPWAVKRIISALKLKNDSLTVEDAAIGAAAKLSLEEKAKEYPEILAICKDLLSHTKGNIKELLREVIDNIETNFLTEKGKQ
ncbi:MAG: hypothetical protein V1747_09900 [Candidatus Omnitrophota bacterium]